MKIEIRIPFVFSFLLFHSFFESLARKLRRVSTFTIKTYPVSLNEFIHKLFLQHNQCEGGRSDF